MKREHLLWGVIAVLLWGGWLLWLWQPERQLRLHQEHLLKAAASRNWSRFSALLADDYSDRWGGDKRETVAAASGVLRYFFALTIQSDTMDLSTQTGVVTARLKLLGRGTPVADLVMERVNGLPSPFVFHWAHRSHWPWDWKLVKVEQPELQVETGF